MRFEFSWRDEDGRYRRFRTSCPSIAESFMRSGSDFPRITSAIRRQFDLLYGSRPGAFANLLRELAQDGSHVELKTGIEGLTTVIRKVWDE